LFARPILAPMVLSPDEKGQPSDFAIRTTLVVINMILSGHLKYFLFITEPSQDQVENILISCILSSENNILPLISLSPYKLEEKSDHLPAAFSLIKSNYFLCEFVRSY